MVEEIQNDLQKLSNLTVQRKMLLTSLIGLLFVLSIIVGSYLIDTKTASNPAPEAVQETESQTQLTVLTIKPAADAAMNIGEEQTVSVILENVAVSVADIVVNFDPTVLSVTKPQNGQTFDRIIQNRVENGQIIFSGALSPERKDTLTTGTVFTFTVRPIKAGSTLITFDRKKTITAVNGINTVGTLSSAQIEIN